MSKFTVEWREVPKILISNSDELKQFAFSKHCEFAESGAPTLVLVYHTQSPAFEIGIGLGSPLGSVLIFKNLKDLSVNYITDGGGFNESSIWWHYSNQMSEIPACTLIPTGAAIDGLIDSLRIGQPSPLVPWESSSGEDRLALTSGVAESAC